MQEREGVSIVTPLNVSGMGQQEQESRSTSHVTSFVINKKNGNNEFFDRDKVYASLKRAVKGVEDAISLDLIMQEITKNLYNQATTFEIEDAIILATIVFIERDPAYSLVASRLLRQKLAKEVIERSTTEENYAQQYRDAFVRGVTAGIEHKIIDARLGEFDLEYLASNLDLKRDDLLEYLGLRTLYERYFFRVEGRRIELPQMFWMRVAMGLAILEENKNERALEFYNLISSLHFVPSTPTLLHAGGTHPQLSSCYLTTIDDDLNQIFKCLGDNAQMSRWSGGIANDWTPLRATGSYIKSIKSGSQGVVPFLKIANDVTAAINRSGSRRGATVAYLEAWHYDFEDFLDLRRNTGDERRRTHDMNTASWLPDLFMKRIIEDKDWTLFSPNDVPDLHDLYGTAFERRYQEYEAMVVEGKIELFKTMKAVDLWRKLLTRLFETGHPWPTFKDACNVRSPQDHVGVIHSSNLCTEITLNTSADETAVCNLGSVNLKLHTNKEGINQELLGKTIKTAIRMLDNVIDINFYPTKEGKNSNYRHRPIGLGVMGFQDALFEQELSFSSQEALDFSDRVGEMVSYYAILSSSQLAKERGAYESYQGSKWSNNIFPVDTIALLEKERGMAIDVDRIEHLDWAPVREHVKKYGMRNSNTMAIAPTATISNISGCYPCIEPMYKNLYVKANMGGEFTVINTYLVKDLKKLNLWNNDMLDLIKYYDGNLSQIDSIPEYLKYRHQEAFQISPEWLVDLTAVRGKWIDQSQSHNVFLQGVSGKRLDAIYRYGWKKGLKTFYYLRSWGASQIEKSTLDAKKFGYTQKREYNKVEESSEESVNTIKESATSVKSACSLLDADCESCQ
ncbi:ribonucleoside-diphosphate reductase subunit alpha [Candidatus Babeliales bacterium]|nr:ribonucleoside-diphosphate reductase subunit alpha [Candidatus Babeliales bacterium]